MFNESVDATVLADWRFALSRAPGEPAGFVREIDAQLAEDPARADLAAFVDLLERAAAAAGSAGFSWKTGQLTQSFFDGDIGRAVLGCKTLGAALQWLAHLSPLIQDATSLRLEIAESQTSLSYKILDPSIWPRHEDAMYSLGIFSKLIRSAAPDAWNHVQVTVEAEQEQVKADLSSIVCAPVVYGGNANAIRFPTSVINAPLDLAPPCDPAILKRLTARLTKKNRSTSITARTRQMIYCGMNDGCVSQEHIARELGISSRTLRRRLADEQQSFQSLLDECRMQFTAFEFRTRKKLSLSEMALKLGYSEHSTFSRAFARWAGMAPQEYRRTIAVH